MATTKLGNEITIVVLAGGQGRRMNKQDKGWILLNGKPLIRHIIDSVSQQSRNILINANQNIERYRSLGYPVVRDTLGNFQGPLAGVAAAMRSVTTPYVLTLPCDAPTISSSYQEKMHAHLVANQTDIAIAFDGERLQPIHALIPTRLMPDLESYLNGESRKVDTWYSRYTLSIVDFSQEKKMFQNLNTPQDLTAYECV